MLLLPAAALSAAVAEADADRPPYGGYGHQPHPQPPPKLYCRPTNTSIYAEVCVPGVESRTNPVGLNIKRVEDDQFCYTKTSTSCREETRTIQRDVCTYEYDQQKVKAGATVTQVTYEEKAETMKVTTCRPTPPAYGGYGHQPEPHYGESGEYQKCRGEYQTQQYRVPKVDQPLEIAVDIAFPEPRQACTTVSIEVTETVCEDNSQEVCIGLAKLVDDRQYVDQVRELKFKLFIVYFLFVGSCTKTMLFYSIQTIPEIGQPDCQQLTLTLPTEACSKGYHKTQ